MLHNRNGTRTEWRTPERRNSIWNGSRLPKPGARTVFVPLVTAPPRPRDRSDCASMSPPMSVSITT